MADNVARNPEYRADLVAYLDGELDEAATLQMERSLADDPALRREVDVLTRTFELLDELPRERASDEFTQRTVSTIQVSDGSRRLKDRPWFRRAGRAAAVAGWLAAVAVSAAVGYLAANRAGPDEPEMLVEEFPVIKNVRLYSEVGSTRYLRNLEESDFFDDEPESSEP